MSAHLYTMAWNEERMLPFFFRHYDPWVDRYVVYDDGSTDATLAMLAAHPRVEVRRFQRTVPDSFVKSATRLQNEMWKESRGQADWVIVTAVDEHLYHPAIHRYLADCRQAGVSAVPALGYHMISESFPEPDETLSATRHMGTPHYEMCKLGLFNPTMIAETGFSLGRHFAEPVGQVVYPEIDELVNLHYKYMGRAYVRQRNGLLQTGLGRHDRKLGLGKQYLLAEQAFDEMWRGLEAKAVDCLDPLVGMHTHVNRWWRPIRCPAAATPSPD